MYVACYRIFQFNLAHINLTWQSFESGDSHTEIPTFPQEPEPIGDDDGERSESPEPEPIDDGDAENGDLGVENEAETEEDSEGSDSMGEEWKQGAAPHDFKAEPIFPEPMFPDNQLGLWRWPDDVPGGAQAKIWMRLIFLHLLLNLKLPRARPPKEKLFRRSLLSLGPVQLMKKMMIMMATVIPKAMIPVKIRTEIPKPLACRPPQGFAV